MDMQQREMYLEEIAAKNEELRRLKRCMSALQRRYSMARTFMQVFLEDGGHIPMTNAMDWWDAMNNIRAHTKRSKHVPTAQGG